MLRKAILVLLSITIFFVVETKSADAAQLINIYEIDNLVNKNKGIYYDSTKDVVKVDFYGTRLKTGDIQYYHDAGLTQKGTYKQFHANTNGWLQGVQFSCTGWYEAKVYTFDGTLAIKLVLQVSDGDLKVDRCDSFYEEPVEDEIQEALCQSLMCECIAEVKASTDAVKQSVDEAVVELKTLNKTTSEIKTVLTDFADEFKTNVNYTVPSMPDTSNLLEKNKPVQNEKPFIDNNTYFKDQGDATDPGKLPTAPDVKDWDGYKQQSPMPPEKNLIESPQLNLEDEKKKEEELKRDSFDSDKELNLDTFISEKELQKDSFEKDSILGIDPVPKIDAVPQIDTFKQTGQFDKTNEMNQNLFFEQTNIFSESGGK